MTPETAQKAIYFMSRATFQGQEFNDFSEVLQALHLAKDQKPEPKKDVPNPQKEARRKQSK